MSGLQIKNLIVRLSTPLGPVTAVDDISFDHEKKQTLALVGETGCGKSIAARAILNLLPANASILGQILLEGKNILAMPEKEISRIRGKTISIVFQNPTLALNPLHTIGHQISELFKIHIKLKPKAAKDLTNKLLEKMGFSHPEKYFHMYPFQFSEGMNQRVCIAAALALNPRIIIADEPTKGLDERLKTDIIEELISIKTKKETSLLLITHDFGLAKAISDRIAIMYCGQLIEIGKSKDFFAQPRHPYSQALLASLPERGFRPVPGVSPSMISPPRGCRFHPRCAQRMDMCGEIEPELIKISGRKVKCFLYR